MARVKDPSVVKDDLQNLLGGLAKDLNRRIYGEGGIPWGTKFADIEELAVQIGQAVSRSMMDQALANQAQTVPEEGETCGVCGATVRSGPPPEPRTMATTVGQVGWEEPQRYCPKCRAAFFPSVPEFGD